MGNSYKRKRVIVISGPTAVGKTGLSISLSRKRNAEIISADARQIYTEMNIGTARPTTEELSQAPHHLVGHVSIHDTYTVADFEREALNKTCQLFENGAEEVIVCGGAGLYIEAFCRGLNEMPEIPEAIRNELTHELKERGLSALVAELQQKDPEYAASADLQNPRRVQRALEVIRTSGSTFSSFRTGQKVSRPFDIIEIGIYREKEDLHKRISLRVDQMVEMGLIEEAKHLYAYRHLNALNTVGYIEIFDYLYGKITLEQAVEAIKHNTRRYAKRQMTWFKKNTKIKWFHAEDQTTIEGYLNGIQAIN